MKVSGSIGWLIIRGIMSRMNSRKAAVRIWSIGRIRKDVRAMPSIRMPRCASGAGDRAPGRRDDPVRAGEQHRADDDPGRVQDRGERVEHEPAVGDEDLAERDRRGEQDLREAVDPEERRRTAPASSGSKPLADRARRSRAPAMNSTTRGDGHHRDRAGQHRPAEVVGGLLAVAPEAAEDRHERGGQAGGHEDVERDLGDPERGVVGVELGAGAVRVREDPVPDDAHREVAEAQDREDDRAARHEPLEQAEQARAAREGAGAIEGSHRPMMTDAATVTRRHDRWSMIVEGPCGRSDDS